MSTVRKREKKRDRHELDEGKVNKALSGALRKLQLVHVNARVTFLLRRHQYQERWRQRETERETERERGAERERHTERHTQRDTQRDTHRDTQRERERERERD
jgi:hypothetical protein